MGALPSVVPCVGAIVHDDEHRLLMIRRANPPAAGRWSLPGGRVEGAETDIEAVRREVVEETGLEVTVGIRIGTVVLPGIDGISYDVRDYACAVAGGRLRAGDDATDARWVRRAELVVLDTAPGLVDTLEQWGMLPR
ncbi:MAG TPA: NUDIX domain-containing protein [Sporichthyaceae bacterium]|jgi:ADP-ribose pyrophosphatase YjhB (NUDIX family)|nr:NUDIX domain-containing protein [Sporichthyaceae bacterium]